MLFQRECDNAYNIGIIINIVFIAYLYSIVFEVYTDRLGTLRFILSKTLLLRFIFS